MIDLVVERTTTTRVASMRAEHVPLLPVFMPVYKSPGILLSREPTIGFPAHLDCAVWHPPKGQDNTIIREELVDADTTGVAHQLSIPQLEFCRMLAKIAHAAVVAHFGLGAIPSNLANYVLGRDQRLTHVVGGSSTACRNVADALHWCVEFGIFNRGDRRFVTVKIELFRFAFLPWIKMGRGPVYWVVICAADNRIADLVNAGPRYPLIRQN